VAGDWIKVEQATLHKVEVLRMAELLGIDRRQMLGLLLDFWSWLDNNARTDSVPNLSRLSLDSVLHCPGFAAKENFRLPQEAVDIFLRLPRHPKFQLHSGRLPWRRRASAKTYESSRAPLTPSKSDWTRTPAHSMPFG